ncbi:MAG: GntR family transcriptional regulator [Erysipelotrichaceae bacterium]|nr:GntR family transcriptional regulator [Erysipelotrichaceae bacterium]
MTKYQMIVDDIIEKIEDGTYREDSRLPSEEELRQSYGCSRVTVRQALKQLQYSGYIISRKGSGSYVASKHKLQSPGRVVSLVKYMTDNDIETKNRVIRLELIDADRFIAEKLGISCGARVYYLERLRFANKKAIVFERKYMSAEMHPYLSYGSLQGSIYGEAERNGITVDHVNCRAVPCFPEKEVADLLTLALDRPVIKVIAHAFTKENQPFFYGEEYYDPDNYQLNFINKR